MIYYGALLLGYKFVCYKMQDTAKYNLRDIKVWYWNILKLNVVSINEKSKYYNKQFVTSWSWDYFQFLLKHLFNLD